MPEETIVCANVLINDIKPDLLADFINRDYVLMPGMRKLKDSSDHKQVKNFGQSFPTRNCSLDGGSQSSADRASASVSDIHVESVQPIPNGLISKGSEETNCEVGGKPLDCGTSGDSGIEIQEAIESSITAQISKD